MLQGEPTAQAVAVRGLCKAFNGTVAVNQIDLDIPRGAIYGIVGPNGAGKTTMISMVAGLLRPDRGHTWVAGYDTWEQPLEVKRAMGLLADGVPVFDRLSGPELLSYVGALRGMEVAVVEERSRELLAALGLEEAGDKRVVDYSAGMTKKILLALALLHNPEVLILDEPLEAVDPVSGRTIQNLLRSYAASGGTVVISSHVMELVEGLCSHVAIINQGQVQVSGSVEEVRGGRSLSDVFVDAVGGAASGDSLTWLGGSQQ
ncbi:ABC transporter ATP-binding protein [Corynebacterium lowii]|uniref:Daunorubicin/doxorubicin resistance ATP-binding protein DrrA n=1 Tax=Corynebacterium lowii TaxID=1544413 RepID=A0A0Q1E250_9CORY|nr:ABC transporter ATP-binding protein [Corynebacterium lowii]KQB86625.1 Daunorubicin/doxorubicin resistance ATP-binding protein DrrA [Corynebacterium lowii]MDP9851309.1 ABC-2 type transport system ATP-binding protein [Corynebacterium lowii]